jgi:hypothetical protein
VALSGTGASCRRLSERRPAAVMRPRAFVALEVLPPADRPPGPGGNRLYSLGWIFSLCVRLVFDRNNVL